jgi:hypothetical protein
MQSRPRGALHRNIGFREKNTEASRDALGFYHEKRETCATSAWDRNAIGQAIARMLSA